MLVEFKEMNNNLIARIILLTKGTSGKSVCPKFLDGRLFKIFNCPLNSQVAGLTCWSKSEVNAF